LGACAVPWLHATWYTMFALSRRLAPIVAFTQLKVGVFYPNTYILFTKVPSSPHTSSHMSGHHPATVRLAGRKEAAPKV
jgi:hypothetical protein